MKTKHLVGGLMVVAGVLAAIRIGPAQPVPPGIQPAARSDAAKPPTSAPDAAAQAKAAKLVLETYKDDIGRAKKPDEKVVLAGKLLQAAIETRDDPAIQFAAMIIARDLATEARNGDMVVSIIDEVARRFQIDEPSMKLDALSKILAEVRKAGNPAAANGITVRITEIKETQAEFARAKGAMATLERNPTDLAANSVVGKFLCFFKEEWDKGLPMLANGNDLPLKALAEKELAKPTEASKQLELADAWWDIGQDRGGLPRQSIGSHAGGLYRAVLPSLSGLTKTRVEKRLNEVPPPRSKGSGPPSVDIVTDGSLFNGKDLTGWTALPPTDAWSVQNGCIVFRGNPTGDIFRLVVAKPLTIGDDFAIEMEIKAQNMGRWGFSLDRGNPWAAFSGAGRQTPPENAWQKIRLVVRKNAESFTVDGKPPPSYFNGSGQVRRQGSLSLEVGFPKNNRVHEAWFRNLRFVNLPE